MMRLSNTLLIFFFLLPSASFAQKTVLTGRVTLFRGKTDSGHVIPISGVTIVAPYSRGAVSDDNGYFSLEIDGIEPGAQIKLQVESYQYAIVNDYILSSVTVGRKEPLEIIVSSPRQQAQAQTKYYNISKKELYSNFIKTITTLRADSANRVHKIAQLEKDFGQKIENEQQAEVLLEQKYQEQSRRLPEVAAYIASINLDSASESNILAYNAFLKGDIDGVLQILDSNKLLADKTKAIETRRQSKIFLSTGTQLDESSKLSAQELIKSYAMRSLMLELNFRYSDAAESMSNIVELYQIFDIDSSDLAGWCAKTANMYRLSNNYNNSLKYDRISMSILESKSWSSRLDLATVYNNLSLIFAAIDNFDSAIAYELKDIAILQNQPQIDTRFLVGAYNNTGLYYEKKFQPTKAIEYYEKSISTELVNPFLDPNDLLTSYNNNAMAFSSIKNYDSCFLYFDSAIEFINANIVLIDTSTSISRFSNVGLLIDTPHYKTGMVYSYDEVDVKNPNAKDSKSWLVSIYNNAGGELFLAPPRYSSRGQYFEVKAIQILQSTQKTSSSQYQIAFDHLAWLYKKENRCDSAEICIDSAIKITERLANLTALDSAREYNNGQKLYFECASYRKARDYALKVVNIFNRNRNIVDTIFVDCYYNLAQSYFNLHNYRAALSWFTEDSKALESRLDQGSIATLIDTYDFMYQCYNALLLPKKATEVLKKKNQLLNGAH